MADDGRRRLRFALPFTVVAGTDRVHLVAGEDARFTLTGAGIEAWAPSILERFDGLLPLDAVVSVAGLEYATAARTLVARLIGERVLVDAPVSESPERVTHVPKVDGSGALADRVRAAVEPSGRAGADSGPRLHVFCQETLDDPAALRQNEERVRDGSPWIWVSTGPMTRAYVGPVFLPWRGPCFGCLTAAFDRLSRAPELRRAVRVHAALGGDLAVAEIPEQALSILAELVRWKLEALHGSEVPAAVFRLHVLEIGTFELSTYGVPVDPDCEAECSIARGTRGAL